MATASTTASGTLHTPPEGGTPPSTPPPGNVPTEHLAPQPLPGGSFTPPGATTTETDTTVAPAGQWAHGVLPIAVFGLALVLIIGAIAYYVLHHRKTPPVA